MKSKFVIILLILLLPFSIYGQELVGMIDKMDLQLGTPAKVRSDFNVADMIGKDQTHYYVLGSEKSKLTLLKYLHDGTMVQSEEILLRHEGKLLKFERAELLNGRLFVFASLIDRKTRNRILYCKEVSTSTLEAVNGYSESFRATLSSLAAGELYSELSADADVLAMFYNVSPSLDENLKLSVAVFDKNMGRLWKQEIEIPVRVTECLLQSISVDEEGNLYFLTREYENEITDRNIYAFENLDYKNRVHVFYNGGKRTFAYDIESTDKWLVDAAMRVSEERLFVYGLYTEKGENRIMGTLTFQVDARFGEVLQSSSDEFAEDFLKQNYQSTIRVSGEEKKGLRHLNRYAITKVLWFSDGSVTIVAQESMVQHYRPELQKGKALAYQATTSPRYYFGNLAVLHFDTAGKLAWNAFIPKNQIVPLEHPYYGSFVVLYTNDKHYVLFNDNPNNRAIDATTEAKDEVFKKESVLMAVEINAQGKVEGREVILWNYHYISKRYVVTCGNRSLRLDGNNFVLAFKTSGKLTMGTFKLN